MIELIIFVIIGIIFLFLMFVIQLYGATWLRGFISGARVTFLELISLSLRKVPVRKIVDVRITLIKAGFNVSVDELSAHHLAGGDVALVAAGMITAKEKNIKLDFRKACELDLNEKQTLHVSSEEKNESTSSWSSELNRKENPVVVGLLILGFLGFLIWWLIKFENS